MCVCHHFRPSWLLAVRWLKLGNPSHVSLRDFHFHIAYFWIQDLSQLSIAGWPNMFLSLRVKIGSALIIPIIHSGLTYHVSLLACKNKNWVCPLPIISIQPQQSVGSKVWHDHSVFFLKHIWAFLSIFMHWRKWVTYSCVKNIKYRGLRREGTR